MRNSQPKVIWKMIAPETDMFQYFDEQLLVDLPDLTEECNVETQKYEGFVDLSQLCTPEELDILLDGDVFESYTPNSVNYPSPAPSSESGCFSSSSPAPSDNGSVSAHTSQSFSPFGTYTSGYPMSEEMSSPVSSIDNSFGDDMMFGETSPAYSNSTGDSPLMAMDPQMPYLTQNFKQEAEVPRSRALTKTAKKIPPKNMKACKHIWQFLRYLLRDPEYKTWITWLDEKRGIFKILKPDETANAWRLYKSQDRRRDHSEDDLDEKDSKKKYPNMARGIRYSRDCGYFESITKNEMRDFGKKLVYKFSKTTTLHCVWLRSKMTA